jgi:hypothetical protein
MAALGKKFLAPALALFVVLATAAAGTGDNDWELVVPTKDGGSLKVCVESSQYCHDVLTALYAGERQSDIDKGGQPICRPHPGCVNPD